MNTPSENVVTLPPVVESELRRNYETMRAELAERVPSLPERYQTFGGYVVELLRDHLYRRRRGLE